MYYFPWGKNFQMQKLYKSDGKIEDNPNLCFIFVEREREMLNPDWLGQNQL